MNWYRKFARFFRPAPALDQPAPTEPIYEILVELGKRISADERKEAEQLALRALDAMKADTDRELVDYTFQVLDYLWNGRDDQEPVYLLSEFLRRHPSEFLAYKSRAIRLWYSGQPEKALNDYDRVVEHTPSGAWCLIERGQVLVEVGKPEEAVSDLKIALEQINSIPNARNATWPAMQAYASNGLGTAFAALGDYSKAFDEYEKSIDLQPENAWVYFNRAQVYEKVGERSKALTDFKQSLSKSGPKLPAYKRVIAEACAGVVGALEITPFTSHTSSSSTPPSPPSIPHNHPAPLHAAPLPSCFPLPPDP
jgi:tetratricopeptide (TPR) repeat protein